MTAPGTPKMLVLVDGPKAGTEMERPRGCHSIVFPFTRMNESGDDQILGDWTYDAFSGHFIEEKVRTTTWNADHYRDFMEWLWRDYDADAGRGVSMRDSDDELTLSGLLDRVLDELNELENRTMSALDDVTARISTDVANAVTTLKAAIAEEATTGADVTALSAAADALEAAGTAIAPAPAAAVDPAAPADPAAPVA